MASTIVILSNNKLPVSVNNGNAIYNIDWSYLENDCNYKLNFSFVSKQIGQTTDLIMNNVYLLTFPDLGSRRCFIAGNTTTTQSSGEIGMLRPYAIGGATANTNFWGLTANTNDNPPIIIRGRPSSNQFTVQIYTIDKTAIYNPVADYVLLLHFEKI
jgi:hypothetical protein